MRWSGRWSFWGGSVLLCLVIGGTLTRVAYGPLGQALEPGMLGVLTLGAIVTGGE